MNNALANAAIWEAIHKYVRACGGNPDKRIIGNVPRMSAVAQVEASIANRIDDLLRTEHTAHTCAMHFKDALSSGELQVVIEVDGHCGVLYVSREMWEAFDERARRLFGVL